MPDRQDSHGDWLIEICAASVAVIVVGAFAALFAYLVFI